MMKDYEKPVMDVILLNGDVVTASCEYDYYCPTETEHFCQWGDD